MSLLLATVLLVWVASFVFFVLALRSAPTIADEEELAALEALRAAPAFAPGSVDFPSLSSPLVATAHAPRHEREGLPVAV